MGSRAESTSGHGGTGHDVHGLQSQEEPRKPPPHQSILTSWITQSTHSSSGTISLDGHGGGYDGDGGNGGGGNGSGSNGDGNGGSGDGSGTVVALAVPPCLPILFFLIPSPRLRLIK